jgi:hypothetical protein
MHAEAVFALPPGEPAVYVEKAVVRAVRGERGLFVVDGGLACWRVVDVAEVHHRPDLWRIVRGDVPDGAALVVRGFSGLRDGTPVVIAGEAPR